MGRIKEGVLFEGLPISMCAGRDVLGTRQRQSVVVLEIYFANDDDDDYILGKLPSACGDIKPKVYSDPIPFQRFNGYLRCL